jgi:hypothetical protein
MMGRDWHLRTAASTGSFSFPGDLRCGPRMMILTGANFQLDYQSALAAPSTLRRSCHPRHHWSEWEVGEGNENLVYPSPWGFNRHFISRKILINETSDFTSHLKEGLLRIFIALRNPPPWPVSNPRTLGTVASTLITTPPRRLNLVRMRKKIWTVRNI